MIYWEEPLNFLTRYTRRLLQALESELNDVVFQHNTEPERVIASVKICRKALSRLKSFISGYYFESLDEEIFFFKSIKPLFYSKYIYYSRVYNFHLKKPLGGQFVVKEFIQLELSDLKRFFESHQSFYHYFRSGSTEMDAFYFTRCAFSFTGLLHDYYAEDHFSTTHDHTLSKLLASEKYQDYLNIQLGDLSDDYFRQSPAIQSQTPFQWTSNKTDLVELIYALVEAGVLNNGNAEIKSVVLYFQQIFQVDLRAYYHKYMDISNRKKERTVFLDKLKTCLLRRIDEKYELKQPPLKRIEFNRTSIS
jgi:hypothetical protein